MQSDLNDIYVFYCKKQWKPYRDCFTRPDSDLYVAVTWPGGFTGFGDSPDSARRMAVSKALMSRKRATAKGLSPADWHDGMQHRVTPALWRLMLDLHDKARILEDGQDGEDLVIHETEASGMESLRPEDLVKQV